MRFSIEVTADPAKEDSDFVFEALQQFNFRQVGNDHHQLLRIFTRNENGELVGGLLGDTYWGWLYIAIVWVREDCRKQGLGKQMLARAEAVAVQRGGGRGARLPACSRGHDGFSGAGFLPPAGVHDLGRAGGFTPRSPANLSKKGARGRRTAN